MNKNDLSCLKSKSYIFQKLPTNQPNPSGVYRGNFLTSTRIVLLWGDRYAWSKLEITQRYEKMPAEILAKSGNHAMLTLMPIFLLYSWLCCAHGCVYTCAVQIDYDWTVVFLPRPIRASNPSRGHHTHTHHTRHTHNTNHTESNVGAELGKNFSWYIL